MKNLELTSPSRMSASARAGEIAAIPAAAIIQTLVVDKPKQKAADLGFLPDQCVYTTLYQEEKL